MHAGLEIGEPQNVALDKKDTIQIELLSAITFKAITTFQTQQLTAPFVINIEMSCKQVLYSNSSP
jgi:L-cysteine desulfidase